MGRTPDRFPGPRIEEEIELEDRTADGDPSLERRMRYVSGAFRLRDSQGVYDPRAGSSPLDDYYWGIDGSFHVAGSGQNFELYEPGN